MIVPLSRTLMLRAIRVGLERQEYADATGKEPYHGNERGGAKALDAIYGAVGECAVAQLLCLPWPDRKIEDDFKGARDVGGILDVRTRRIPGPGPELGIKPNDDEVPFVLAHFLARISVIDVIGWAYPSEGKQFGRWDETSGCWYLPPPYRSVDDLIRQFGKERAA